MNKGSLKNIVVLKELPSNIVEEAIVILKSNAKLKKVENTKKSKNANQKEDKKTENNYILKEAEMLISNYINVMEQKKENKKEATRKNNIKYKRIKNYAYIVSIIILIESILLIIK